MLVEQSEDIRAVEIDGNVVFLHAGENRRQEVHVRVEVLPLFSIFAGTRRTLEILKGLFGFVPSYNFLELRRDIVKPDVLLEVRIVEERVLLLFSLQEDGLLA